MEIREVDRENRNGARARKQAAASAGVEVDGDGNVHRLTSTTLVVPEEKRCVATTLAGSRCKVGRMRGLEVCIFHSHLALQPEALETLADGQKPRLSPRRALKHQVELQSDALALAAVRGALDADGPRATSAVLALVDAVDPLVTTDSTLTWTKEGVEAASFRELHAVYGTPS